MAILAIFSAPNFSREQYDSLRKEVNWEGNKPTGALFHVASFDDSGGIKVADVWNSKEELDTFVGSRLLPAMQKANVPAPKVEVYDAHNINAFPSLDRHRLK